MKQPRPKPHLVVSPEPLKAGSDCKGVCGTPIPRADFIFEGELPVGSFRLDKFTLKILVCCAKCKKSAFPRGRYLYGAIAGQEMFDGESAKQGEAE